MKETAFLRCPGREWIGQRGHAKRHSPAHGTETGRDDQGDAKARLDRARVRASEPAARCAPPTGQIRVSARISRKTRRNSYCGRPSSRLRTQGSEAKRRVDGLGSTHGRECLPLRGIYCGLSIGLSVNSQTVDGAALLLQHPLATPDCPGRSSMRVGRWKPRLTALKVRRRLPWHQHCHVTAAYHALPLLPSIYGGHRLKATRRHLSDALRRFDGAGDHSR